MNRRICLSLIAVLIAVACGSDTGLRTNPTTPTPVISTVVIQGAPSVGPGQTAQAAAIARFSDGSERGVTADAQWSSTQPQIATVAAGVITGLALGRTVIRAAYMNRNAVLTVVVKPEGTFVVSGSITEPGAVSVPAATVTVTALGSPSFQITASSTGFYELFGVSGTVTLRVSKSGYLDETQTLTLTQDSRLDWQIKPAVAPTPVAGTYGVTLTISPSCSIVPDDQKRRTYSATITQDNARLAIQLGDANFVSVGGGVKNKFNGQESGSTVTFDWGDGYYVIYYGANVQETLSGGQILGIWGRMVATATGQTIAGNLVGGFTYREGNRTLGCSAPDNTMTFTRK